MKEQIKGYKISEYDTSGVYIPYVPLKTYDEIISKKVTKNGKKFLEEFNNEIEKQENDKEGTLDEKDYWDLIDKSKDNLKDKYDIHTDHIKDKD